MKISLLFLLSVLWCSLIAKDIYVSPFGGDTASGENSDPVQTLEKALQIAESSFGKDSIYLSEGLYEGTSVAITPKLKGLKIMGEGPKTQLCGGVVVRDWEWRGNLLIAPVPGTKNRDWDFRMLIVNGEVRDRSRLPDSGAYTHGNDFEVRWLSSFAGGWERKPTDTELHLLNYLGEDIPASIDVANAELTIYHEWDETLVGLKAHDPDQKTVTFRNTPMHPPGAFAERNENAQTYVLWNTKAGMTRPGQWYLDRSNEELVYWPLKGESPDNIEVVIPKHEQVITFVKGSRDVEISNLSVTASSTPLITGRYAAMAFDGAIHGEFKKNVSIHNVALRNISGWGIKLKGDDLLIQNSEIAYLGAGAVFYSGDNVVVDRCEIHDAGIVYPSAVGVLGRGEQNRVSHNHIYNMPYCGINNVGSHSVVEGNVIYNIKGFMQDGGAIYMINHQGTVVRNNAVFGNPDRRIPVYAYYLDERCEDCIVENNLAVETWVPVQGHMTKNCTYTNNLFIDSKLQSIRYALSADLSYTSNIHVADVIEFVGSTPTAHDEELTETNPELQKYFEANGMVPREGNVYAAHSGEVIQEKLVLYDTYNRELLNSEKDIYNVPIFKNPVIGDFSFDNLDLQHVFDTSFVQENPLILSYLERILPSLN